jgi:hypothetical protein
MDEYIRADNDFRKRREKLKDMQICLGASEGVSTQGMSGVYTTNLKQKIRQIRLKDSKVNHKSQVPNNHHKTASDHQPQGCQGGRNSSGRFNSQPRKPFYLFCGEDKGCTTRTCQVTIQKQKEIVEAEARQIQSKQVFHTSYCFYWYILGYAHHQHPNPQPSRFVASASHSPAR